MRTLLLPMIAAVLIRKEAIATPSGIPPRPDSIPDVGKMDEGKALVDITRADHLPADMRIEAYRAFKKHVAVMLEDLFEKFGVDPDSEDGQTVMTFVEATEEDVMSAAEAAPQLSPDELFDHALDSPQAQAALATPGAQHAHLTAESIRAEKPHALDVLAQKASLLEEGSAAICVFLAAATLTFMVGNVSGFFEQHR